MSTCQVPVTPLGGVKVDVPPELLRRGVKHDAWQKFVTDCNKDMSDHIIRRYDDEFPHGRQLHYGYHEPFDPYPVPSLPSEGILSSKGFWIMIVIYVGNIFIMFSGVTTKKPREFYPIVGTIHVLIFFGFPPLFFLAVLCWPCTVGARQKRRVREAMKTFQKEWTRNLAANVAELSAASGVTLVFETEFVERHWGQPSRKDLLAGKCRWELTDWKDCPYLFINFVGMQEVTTTAESTRPERQGNTQSAPTGSEAPVPPVEGIAIGPDGVPIRAH
jgi:hypothetical protein